MSARRRRPSPRATAQLIVCLTKALGPPVSTPELIGVAPGRYERASFRVHKWKCPACRAWWEDSICRPLVVTSDGRLYCSANWCAPEEIAAALCEILGAPRGVAYDRAGAQR